MNDLFVEQLRLQSGMGTVYKIACDNLHRNGVRGNREDFVGNSVSENPWTIDGGKSAGVAGVRRGRDVAC